MMSAEGDNIDAWTGMPLELDEIGAAALNAQPILPSEQHSSTKFDIKALFWKFIASGSADTPPAVLMCLAAEERVQIRRRVAENRNTPPEGLALLADDPVGAVRAAVARNPHTPVYLLRKLSQDSDVDVRYAIASNGEMPDAILLSLFMDPDPYVAERASQTLAM